MIGFGVGMIGKGSTGKLRVGIYFDRHMVAVIFASALLISFVLSENLYSAKSFCLIKLLFGFDCPLCGLTRAFVSISHGNIIESFSFNKAGVFVYASFILYIVVDMCRFFKLISNKKYFFMSMAVLVLSLVTVGANWCMYFMEKL